MANPSAPHPMNGAGRFDLGVIGAVIMEFYCTEVDNKSYTTKQLCYICEKLDGVYLRRQELTDLWCISPQFPVPLSTPPLHSKAVCTTDNSEQCSCPTRPDHPPPLPTEVPPSIDISEAGSVDKLKEWILNYYESTAFNTCKHQPLHYMTGSPLQLHVDPQATPVAFQRGPQSITLDRKGQS